VSFSFSLLFANIFSSAHSSLLIRAVGFHTVLPHLCVFLSLFFLSSLRIFRSIRKQTGRRTKKTTWRGDLASSHRTRHTPFTTRAPRGVSSEKPESLVQKRTKRCSTCCIFGCCAFFSVFRFFFSACTFELKVTKTSSLLVSSFLSGSSSLAFLFCAFSSDRLVIRIAHSSSSCFTLR